MELAPASTDRSGRPTPRTLVSTRERPRRRGPALRRPPQRRPPPWPDPSTLLSPAGASVHPVDQAEGALIAQWQRARRRLDPRAPELAAFLLEANASLLQRTARHRARRLEPDDIAQSARVGLLTALSRFRPDRGVPFGPYAIHWIRKEVQRTVAAGDHQIAVPAHRLGDLAVIRRSDQADAGADLRRTVERHLSRATSDGLRTVLAVVPAGRATEAVEDASTIDLIEWQLAITRALGELPPRAAAAVRLRHGLGDGQPKTLRQIAGRLGISDHTVRSDLARAHQQLARLLAGGR